MPLLGLSPHALFRRALAPFPAFRARATVVTALGPALGGLLLWRSPLWLLGTLLELAMVRRVLEALGRGDVGILGSLGLSPGDLAPVLSALPPLPTPLQALPWLALAAPLAVLGLWMHHWAWDHLALWLLRGVGPGGSRASALAEAEALTVGALVLPLGLLASLPGVAALFGLASLLGGLYAWGLRGVALAAWHGCPLWKGLAATLLHMVLVGLFYGALALATVLVVTLALV